jgi:hypothetical protein
VVGAGGIQAGRISKAAWLERREDFRTRGWIDCYTSALVCRKWKFLLRQGYGEDLKCIFELYSATNLDHMGGRLYCCVMQVDMATVMAEMYDMGDKDRNEKLEKREFIKVRVWEGSEGWAGGGG